MFLTKQFQLRQHQPTEKSLKWGAKQVIILISLISPAFSQFNDVEEVHLGLWKTTFQLGSYKTADGTSDEFRFQSQENDCKHGKFVGHTKNFDLLLSEDRDSIRFDKNYIGFTYKLYLQRRGYPSTCRTLKVAAIPHGGFLDDTVDLPLMVGGEAGVARLPIHALRAESFLSIEGMSQVHEVDLGKSKGLRIKVKNHLPSLGILILSATCVPSDPKLWAKISESTDVNIVVPPGAEMTLPEVHLQPDLLQAIWSQFRPNKVDTSIDVLLKFQSELGGIITQTHPYVVEVKFMPPIPYLFLTAVLGGFLGSLLKYSKDQKGRSKGKLLNVVVDTMITAFIVELVGLALNYMQTNVILFGHEISPHETLPVFFVSLVLVGFFRLPVLESFREGFIRPQEPPK